MFKLASDREYAAPAGSIVCSIKNHDHMLTSETQPASGARWRGSGSRRSFSLSQIRFDARDRADEAQSIANFRPERLSAEFVVYAVDGAWVDVEIVVDAPVHEAGDQFRKLHI